MTKYIPFTLLFVIALLICHHAWRNHQRVGQRLTSLTFTCYLIAVCWLTMTPASLYIPTASKKFFYFHMIAINVIPFQGVSEEFFLNIVMTIPAGVYLYLSPLKHRSALRIILSGIAVGLTIESLQFVFDLLFDIQRTVDIDDVITNAIGVTGGYLVMMIIDHWPLSGLVKWLSLNRRQE